MVSNTARVHRMLVIADDLGGVGVNARLFKRAGVEVHAAATTQHAFRLESQFAPTLILLDADLANSAVQYLCATFRRCSTTDAHVIVVSSRKSESDVVQALQVGADDYLVKPLSEARLLARIQSFVRRRERAPASAPPKHRTIGNIVLERESRVLRCESRTSVLHRTEFRLLWLLTETPGRLLSRTEILLASRTSRSQDSRLIDVQIAKLRKRLLAIGAHATIASVRGSGYRFDVLPINGADGLSRVF